MGVIALRASFLPIADHASIRMHFIIERLPHHFSMIGKLGVEKTALDPART
jgi:hypothetical protein